MWALAPTSPPFYRTISKNRRGRCPSSPRFFSAKPSRKSVGARIARPPLPLCFSMNNGRPMAAPTLQPVRTLPENRRGGALLRPFFFLNVPGLSRANNVRPYTHNLSECSLKIVGANAHIGPPLPETVTVNRRADVGIRPYQFHNAANRRGQCPHWPAVN